MIMANISNLFAQHIEIFGGVNRNIFHDYNEFIQGHSTTYFPQYGFAAGLGLDSIKLGWLKMRFTLQFDHYRGIIEAKEHELSYYAKTNAKINKSVLSVGIWPANFRFMNKIDLNLGFLISRLVNESFSGTYYISFVFRPWMNYNLQDKYSRYSSKTYFGIQGRISYDILISKSTWISPQYLYYFGFSNEFIHFPIETKSMRHYFCIGFKKNY